MLAYTPYMDPSWDDIYLLKNPMIFPSAEW